MLNNTKPQPLTTTGTDNHFVEFFMDRTENGIELRAVAVEYRAFTGRYIREELGVETVSEEEAIDAASDLQGAANAYLDNLNHAGFSSPISFPRAVKRELDTDHKAQRAYLAAAISHNAKLFASASAAE
jgi:hypothetical protein